MSDDAPVTLVHPDHPGHPVEVTPRKARLLARQGWVPVNDLPSPPNTADTED